MQGTYVLTPRGRCIGRINTRNVDAVVAMLERALTQWGELGAEERLPPTAATFAPVHRWENSYPADGLILERFARDIGTDPTAEPRQPVNSDTVWFTRDEARSLLPTKLEVGAETEVPAAIGRRLARLSLVDNVRGQTLPFAASEVADSTMKAAITEMADETIELRISGSTRAVSEGPWLGGDNYWRPKREWPRWIHNRLHGRATFDVSTGRFTAFELIALGERQGRTTFNGRHREDADTTYRIGFLLQLAPEHWRIAPTFINVYDADWVIHPGQ